MSRIGHILDSVLFIQLFYHLWVLKGLIQVLVAANTVTLLFWCLLPLTLLNHLQECT